MGPQGIHICKALILQGEFGFEGVWIHCFLLSSGGFKSFLIHDETGKFWLRHAKEISLVIMDKSINGQIINNEVREKQ